MDITQKKILSTLSDVLKTLITKLQINKIPILLLGSAGYSINQYPSDYDLFTNINKINDLDLIYSNIISKLLYVLENDNIYFIELKIQLINGTKYKINSIKEIESIYDLNLTRKQIDFIKLDFIIYENYKFIETSLIYSLNKVITNDKKLIDNLNNDVKELMNEGNYYKACKRMYSIYLLEKNYTKMKKLLELFNSYYGYLYNQNANLEAILTINKLKLDKSIKTKMKYNLSLYKLKLVDLKRINQVINLNKNIINLEAKKYID